jgi:hypothetical protein
MDIAQHGFSVTWWNDHLLRGDTLLLKKGQTAPRTASRKSALSIVTEQSGSSTS